MPFFLRLIGSYVILMFVFNDVLTYVYCTLYSTLQTLYWKKCYINENLITYLYIPFVQFNTEGAHFIRMADVTVTEEKRMQDQVKTMSAELSQSMKVCVWKAGLATFIIEGGMCRSQLVNQSVLEFFGCVFAEFDEPRNSISLRSVAAPLSTRLCRSKSSLDRQLKVTNLLLWLEASWQWANFQKCWTIPLRDACMCVYFNIKAT